MLEETSVTKSMIRGENSCECQRKLRRLMGYTSRDITLPSHLLRNADLSREASDDGSFEVDVLQISLCLMVCLLFFLLFFFFCFVFQ